ncbi:ABC transporter ATP-binding protein [Halobacteria archaeon AArc-curdl1]|uniref:Nickel import system ATP-binding protein NikD n=1 Tax=Natronosalvus hydrolyticus TaxID=2979988 RepID=A0AAP3E8L7_9EURY|nr:ABC transporter ATP-binding protein [Halobacteria archaeon AArc-curdl1]
MSNPLLEVKDLHVEFDTYDGTAQVINGIDLIVERGETVAIVGESGCGKSVTVKTILGLLPEADISQGEILYKGENLLELSDAKRHARRGKEMSMIMQNPMSAINPVFTVGEQMLDVLKWQGQHRVGITDWVRDKFRSEAELRERAIDMLEQVDISAPERVFESYPVELSGGMRQRVLIAIALLLEPDFLIADEPGTALDVTTEANILELLDDIVEEHDTSVLYITHDLGVAREISDQLNVMYAGEIVETAPTETLFEDPQHPYTRGLLESIPQLSRGIGAGIPGKLPDYTDPPTGCRFADRCPHAETECREVVPHLRRTEPEHAAACHLFEGDPHLDRHQDAVTEFPYIGPPPWQADTDETEVDVR